MSSLYFIRGGLVSCSMSLILQRVVALLSRKPQCHWKKKVIENIGGEINDNCNGEVLTQTHSQRLSLAAPSSHQEDRICMQQEQHSPGWEIGEHLPGSPDCRLAQVSCRFAP